MRERFRTPRAATWSADWSEQAIYLVHEVPEARFRHNFVRREELHAVRRRLGIRLGGSLSAHHLKQQVDERNGGRW